MQGPDPGSSVPTGSDAGAMHGDALRLLSRASLHKAPAPTWCFMHLYGF